MSAIEIAQPRFGIESQVNIPAWVNNLISGIRNPQHILEEIEHVFYEYSVDKAAAVTWEFQLPRDWGYIIDSFVYRGVKTESARSRMEIEEGFLPLINKINEAEIDSIGIWPYPPGDELDGFNPNYGFFYIYHIKVGANGEKNVTGYALRVQPYNEETALAWINLLKTIGRVPPGGTDEERLLRSPHVFPLGHEAVIPIGENKASLFAINSIKDLSVMINLFMPKIFPKETLDQGFKGKLMAKVRNKYHDSIYKLFNLVLIAAKDRKQFNFQIARDILQEHFYHINQGGSCAVVESNKAGDFEIQKEEGESYVICRRCGYRYNPRTNPKGCPFCSSN